MSVPERHQLEEPKKRLQTSLETKSRHLALHQDLEVPGCHLVKPESHVRRPGRGHLQFLNVCQKHPQRTNSMKTNADNVMDWRNRTMLSQARLPPTPLRQARPLPTPLHLEEQDPEALKPQPKRVGSSLIGPPTTWDAHSVYCIHVMSAACRWHFEGCTSGSGMPQRTGCGNCLRQLGCLKAT